MTILATEGLTRRFPRVTALDRLTLTVGPGVTGLVGANGAGKSTLIKILLGLLAADAAAARTVLGLDAATQRRRDPPARRLHARARLPAARRVAPPSSSSTWPGCPACRRTAARERTADMLRHVGLYEERYRADRRLLHRHEAAGQAGPGAGPRPAPAAARRADQRPRPGRPRRDARPDPPDRHRVRHRRAGHLAPARRDRAGLRPRRRHRRRQAAARRRPSATFTAAAGASCRRGRARARTLARGPAAELGGTAGRPRDGRMAARPTSTSPGRRYDLGSATPSAELGALAASGSDQRRPRRTEDRRRRAGDGS